MIPPTDCPYKGLSAPPCWSCARYMPDIDQCMNNVATARIDLAQQANSVVTNAQTFEERMKRYNEDRKQLLKLSKDSLVDLILKKPTYY